MIEQFDTGYPKIVGFRLSGKLRDEDYKKFVPMVEAILAAERKVNLFVLFEDFHGWDLRAAWEDIKFASKHYSDFERIALAGEREWQSWMAKFCIPFTQATVKYFDVSESDAALAWLAEGL